jgi:hypothetical protein
MKSQFSLILSVFLTVYNKISDPISIFLYFCQVLKDQCKKLEADLCIFKVVRLKRSPWDIDIGGPSVCSIKKQYQLECVSKA